VERVWENLDHEGEVSRGRVRVSWKNAPKDLSYGDVLVLEGELSAFKGRRNPGGFDAKAYWERQNVEAAFFTDSLSRFRILDRGKGNALVRQAIRWKQAISRRITSDFGERDAAFLKALYLGERSDLEQDFKDLFLRTGTMHLLAVSGFNVGFLTAILWLFLKPLPLPRNLKLGTLLSAVWAYCLLVGWQAPVARASVMATIFIFGKILGRKSDGLNTLGLAACVILGLNPKQLFDVGFQLSFVAVLGLLSAVPAFLDRPALLPHEKRTFMEKTRFAGEELFWVSFVCLFVTLPITVQNFYIVTPYALLANLVVVPLTFLLFLLGAPYLLAAPFFSEAVWVVTMPMKLVSGGIVHVLFFLENIPGAVFAVGSLDPWLWSFLALGTGLILFTPYFKTCSARALVLVFFCMNVFALQELRRNLFRKFEMTQLDVGQGDAAYFEFPKGGNLLVDAGSARFSDKGRWVLNPFLRSKGVRALDAVVISHPQEDHVGGLAAVLEDVRVKQVFHAGFAYESPRWHAIEKMIHDEKAVVTRVGRGSRIEGFKDIRISILHPKLDETADPNINNESVVLKLEIGDVSFLMTGDIQSKAMGELLASGQDLDSDVLKVPHHGAKMDETGRHFLEAVSPYLSLISSGERNPFGHPSGATLDLLGRIPGNRVLRTDLLGAVRVRSDGSQITLD
jgi:competence protein ComEC